jgi:hypothetical protein
VVGQPGQPGVGVLDRSGMGCPGASRYSRDSIETPARATYRETGPSKIGTEPRIIPPPCKYSTAALLSLDGWRYHLASSVAPSDAVTLVVADLDLAGNWLRLVVEILQHRVQRDAAAGDVTGRRGWRRTAAFDRRGEDRGHLSV